jgi:hypothetical protein
VLTRGFDRNDPERGKVIMSSRIKSELLLVGSLPTDTTESALPVDPVDTLGAGICASKTVGADDGQID